MTDFSTILKDLRRPRLLIRAARHGLSDYRRDREAEIEGNRQTGSACYNVARHIEVLIALMAEARLLPRAPV
jgi:hypothetical protein